MKINENKKLWLHRRIIVYITTLVFILTFPYVIITLPIERVVVLKEIILGFYGVCGIIIALYFILTTLHDKNFLPELIQLTNNIKKR